MMQRWELEPSRVVINKVAPRTQISLQDDPQLARLGPVWACLDPLAHLEPVWGLLGPNWGCLGSRGLFNDLGAILLPWGLRPQTPN